MAETIIELPRFVKAPIGVFVNGVQLTEGEDFSFVGGKLIVKRELAKEGKLGFWRWFLGAWGVGTYRKNDVVDVRYTRDGASKILHDVEFVGATTPDA
jgi:hypothetical protein